MEPWLWAVFIFLVGQRLVELRVAKRNENWLKAEGAYEVGSDHYKWFVLTHTFFLAFLLIEAFLSPFHLNILLQEIAIYIFVVTQLLRIWCIYSLGKFWNTKIIVLPGANLVKRGPYQFIKHPNYIIVGIELLVIPFMFQAYISAILFPLIHLILLKVRIPIEEQALAEAYIKCN